MSVMKVPAPGAAPADRLRDRLQSRRAVVGIIGMGYVGLPLAHAVHTAGYRVIGYDIDPVRVDTLNAGRSQIKSVASEIVADMVASGRFAATADSALLQQADVIVICVPTPLDRHREPDLSFIVNTAETIAPNLQPGQLVALESTTYPGTTAEVVKPILERTGLVSEQDFFLAYSPEREDPGNARFKTADIPKVVGGDGPLASELACLFYESVVSAVVAVSSTQTAEAVKLTENIFRAVNIALANELKFIYSRMGINVWEVIDAAKTKPFGFMPFYPGPGLGGHCIPIDPFYLTWKAREFDITTRFIELAGEINRMAPFKVIESLIEALSHRKRMALNGARILVLGIAYKKNVDDLRESPALTIMELLERHGAVFDYYDPHVAAIPTTREHAGLAGRRSLPWDPAAFARYDAVLICTDHDEVDYAALVEHCDLIVDTRNATAAVSVGRERIVRA